VTPQKRIQVTPQKRIQVTPQKRWLLGSAVAAVVLYALLWIGYASQWTWLAVIDSWALEPAYDYGIKHPGWVSAWNIFCTVLGPTMFRLASLVLMVVALVRRNFRVAMLLLLSVGLSGLVVEAAKRAASRPRPATALVATPETAFPSGHALGVIVGVLALLAVGLPGVRRSLRIWLVAFGAVVVVAIGVGRVVLTVHHPSDVLAGWALGYAYFVLCLLMVWPSRPITAPDEIPEAPGIAR
jgi:membrane-associated phospholipid phosphatase